MSWSHQGLLTDNKPLETGAHMPSGDADCERRVVRLGFGGQAARDPWAPLLWAHCCPEPWPVQRPRGSLLRCPVADGASVVTTRGDGASFPE